VWWVHIYWWLEANNLYKATVAFWVTLILGAIAGVVLRPWRAWKRHRETQEKIADRLDTSTPGGLSDLMDALHGVLDDTDDGDPPDDNGTDSEDELERRKKGHGSSHAGTDHQDHTEHSIIPNPIHGGGSAGHR